MVFMFGIIIITVILGLIFTRNMYDDSFDRALSIFGICVITIIFSALLTGVIISLITPIPVEENTYNLEMIDGDTYIMVNPENDEYVVKVENEEGLVFFKTIVPEIGTKQVYYKEDTHILRETIYETPAPWSWIFFKNKYTAYTLIIPEGMINYQHPYYNN